MFEVGHPCYWNADDEDVEPYKQQQLVVSITDNQKETSVHRGNGELT